MTRDEKWLAAAMMYVEWFGFSVLPMGDDKKPMVLWKELQTRRPTTDELHEWPKENIAIITGEISGLAVIDCESRDDYEWFWKNRGQTPMVTKTRRGYHLYFRHPGQRVSNAQRVTDESGTSRYDVRGDGGYVLAPPSRHSEGSYYWVTMPYRTDFLPKFDMAWRPETPEYRNTDRIIHDGEAYISAIRAVSGQGGHSETFKVVQRLKESGMRESEAIIALQRWNATNAEPPWSEKELLHKIQDVYG